MRHAQDPSHPLGMTFCRIVEVTNFLKMQGLGNDFVILNQRSGRRALEADFIKKLADRHFGVGCDQVIVMEPSQTADVFMRIYNPDGSEAESCGNATRCVADIITKDLKAQGCTIETLGGVLSCRRDGDLIEVDMGAPKAISEMAGEDWGEDLPVPVSINMGNPHCVFFVEDAEKAQIKTLGPMIEHHKDFPHRTNVEFAHIVGKNQVRLRVWERGAGVTLACGSGACATMVAAVSRGLTGRKAEIIMDGGSLRMEWRESDGHVLMTGPVAYVFEGSF